LTSTAGHFSPNEILDFRSDTLTKPTPAMREFMMAAEVGDSYYEEDPSVLSLERKVALLFGTEAAIFMPTGTMSNQVGVRLHCSPGDALLIPLSNHIVQFETGALSGINGVQAMEPALHDGWKIDSHELEMSFSDFGATHASMTKAVAVENTHLVSGGQIYPFEELKELSAACRSLNLGFHLDGARIWHASVVEGRPLSAYGALFDTLSVCFSKGLGAPVGSALLGTREKIAHAKRFRKMFGGSMRQCGFLAAAAEFALDHHVERLAEDHMNAKILANFFRKHVPEAVVPEPQTNLVFIRMERNSGGRSAKEIAVEMESRFGMKISAFDSRTLRAVTHLNISTEMLKQRTV
jgi:threonine aldolase